MSEQEQRLSAWIAVQPVDPQTGSFGDSLRVGLTFPLQRDETVIVHRGFRANRYCKRGALLRFAGLSAYATLFLNQSGQFITVQHGQLSNFIP